MTTDNKLEIAFGRRTYPDSVRAVWGARLIWPNDLVQDRQDIAARDERSKNELITWLNGVSRGDGALNMMRIKLVSPGKLGLGYSNDREVVIYEDDKGKIIGSAQSSHGYIYVAGWLK